LEGIKRLECGCHVYRVRQGTVTLEKGSVYQAF